MAPPSKKPKITEKLLYRYGQIVGLSPFTVDDAEIIKFSYFGIFYGMIVSTIFLWIFYKTMEERLGTKLRGETTMAMLSNCSGDFFQIGGMCITWMTFAFRQKRILAIVESFIGTSITASKLGIVENERNRFFTRLGIHVILVNIGFWSITLIDHGLMLMDINFQAQAYFTILDCGHFVCRNLIVLFVDLLLLIRKRFARLNETTRNLATIRQRRQRAGSLRDGYDKFNSLSEKVEIVGQLHRELIDLAEMIRDFCSLPLLMTISMHFIQMVTNCYIISLWIVGRQPMDWHGIGSFLMVFVWLIMMNSVEPFVITYVCNSTNEEACLTASVLHEMWNECNTSSRSCSRMVDKVSLSLLQNRLNMKLYGIFDLNLTLIYKIGGTVTTYVIILMQLDQQQAEEYVHNPTRTRHFH